MHLRNIDQTQQHNYLFGYLPDYSRVEDSGDYVTEFMVKGKSVCREAWLLIQSFSKEWFRGLLKKFKEDAVKVEHENKGV